MYNQLYEWSYAISPTKLHTTVPSLTFSETTYNSQNYPKQRFKSLEISQKKIRGRTYTWLYFTTPSLEKNCNY